MAATGAVAPRSNGLKPTDQVSKEIVEYEKILRIRDEVFANTHPRLKISVQPPSQDRQPAAKSSPSVQTITNGAPKLPEANQPTAELPMDSDAPPSQTTVSLQKLPNAPRISKSGSGSSGIDPIFLTKSEVLVKAELHQKRQRIERALEEQSNQKKAVVKQRTFDQDAAPEFDVTDVLRQAQELVKPFKAPELSGANGSASSDSFDENTFYSSEMNETTTQEADRSDKSPRWRSNQPCSHFLEGGCPYGEACAFSHDPALKRREEVDRPQAMELDSVNTNEQANAQTQDKTQQAPPSKPTATIPSSKMSRIAELEEQLRLLKSQQAGAAELTSTNHTKEPSDEEPMYSPPDARVPSLSGQHAPANRVVEIEEDRRGRARRRSLVQHIPAREYDKRDKIPPSPFHNDMRVIRNHITSPVAPQPARVSPLAVAKVPPLSQRRHNLIENDDPFQWSTTEVLSAGPSPNVSLQPLSSRKRRREVDIGERARNVAPRRDVISPEVRIKDEPLSPPPFSGVREVWQPPRRQEVQRPIYVDNEPPLNRDRGRVVYNHRPLDRATEVYLPDERRPLTPVVRRIVSRAGRRYDTYEEPDLRRMVSARQIRAPLSPVEQYAVPHPASARAASQVYLPQPGPAGDYRASVQPQPAPYLGRDRSLSPIAHQARATPLLREPIPMAPPARRIVQDEYGNRYIEAPLRPDRHASVAPVRRPSEFAPRYAELAPRNSSARDPQLVEAHHERQFIPRGPSPTSPRYVEYAPVPRGRPVIDRESGVGYGEDSYGAPSEGVRIIEYPDPHPVGPYGEVIRPREAVARMQSVRPVSSRYDDARERVTRVQSVRPEQDRIVSLGGRRELLPQASRQVSVRAEDVYTRPLNYAVEERSQYQYTDGLRERRFVEDDVPHVSDLYEAPGSAGGRPLQRL